MGTAKYRALSNCFVKESGRYTSETPILDYQTINKKAANFTSFRNLSQICSARKAQQLVPSSSDVWVELWFTDKFTNHRDASG